jgi:hypothetical protein
MSGSDMGEKQGHQNILADPHHYASQEVSVGPKSIGGAAKRARLLEESTILPGEASFATVKLNQGRVSKAYSPATEFLTKAIRSGKLAIGVLVLILIGGVITFALLKKSTTQRARDQNPSSTAFSEFPAAETKPATQTPPAPVSNVQESPVQSKATASQSPAATVFNMPEFSPVQLSSADPQTPAATVSTAQEFPPVRNGSEGGNTTTITTKARVNNLGSKLRLSRAPKSPSMSVDNSSKDGKAELRTTPLSAERERPVRPAAETYSPPHPLPTSTPPSGGTNSKPKVIPWP